MTAAELSALSDQELSDKVALEVAGFVSLRMSTRWEVTDPPDQPLVVLAIDSNGNKEAIPKYATSADAVLPLIGMNYFSANRNPFNGVWTATVGAGPVFEAQDKSFARAVAIALLLAKGAA